MCHCAMERAGTEEKIRRDSERERRNREGAKEESRKFFEQKDEKKELRIEGAYIFTILIH
jgi:hypothetical protein